MGSLSEVAQVVIFHTFYGTWRIIPFVHVQGHTIQSTSICPHSCKMFLILSSHVYLDITFFHKSTVCIAVHSRACYMLSLFYPPWFQQPHKCGNYKPWRSSLCSVFHISVTTSQGQIFSALKHSQSFCLFCVNSQVSYP
jgi:hypothetical protein